MSTQPPATVSRPAPPGANISHWKKLPWFQPTIGSSLTPAGRGLLEGYSGLSPEKVETHIHEIRDVAWEIYPWPCVGEFWFVTLGLSLHPYYPTLLGRLTKPSSPPPSETATTEHNESLRLLDLGTCLGQDLRKLLHDGVPISSLYGSDLFPEYENAGHALFRDASVFTKGHFIAADLLDDSSTENGLVSTEGTWDMIAITMFLDIWGLKTQGEACRRILKLLKRREGSLIVGSQTGNEQPHELQLKPPFSAEGEERSVYRHNPEWFRMVWMGVGDEVGVRLDVQVDYAKQEGSDQLVGEGAVEKGKRKFFMGAQDRRLASKKRPKELKLAVNTDIPTSSKAGYVEAWVDPLSPKGPDSQLINITDGSGFKDLAKAMVDSKLSVAQGFRGLARQLFLFYQTNSRDMTWRIRNEHNIGQWTDPTFLNVGI